MKLHTMHRRRQRIARNRLVAERTADAVGRMMDMSTNTGGTWVIQYWNGLTRAPLMDAFGGRLP